MGTATLTELLVVVLGAVVLLVVGLGGFLLWHRQRSAAREHQLHQDLHEQRQDIERREHRLGEKADVMHRKWIRPPPECPGEHCATGDGRDRRDE